MTEASSSGPTARTIPHPDVSELRITPVLQALADPSRMAIVLALVDSDDERPCGTLDTGLSPSTMTHHLRVLRDAGIILMQPRGRRRYTSLRRQDLDARFPGLLSIVVAAAREGATP